MNERYAIAIIPGEKAFFVPCDSEGYVPMAELSELLEGPIETLPSSLASCWGDCGAGEIVLAVNALADSEGPVSDIATDLLSGKVSKYIHGNAVLAQQKGRKLIGFDESKAEKIFHQWCEVEA